MKTVIIIIGNTRGIRIPMVLFEESGLSKEVEIKVSKVMLQMISIEPVPRRANETALLSEPILRGDWDSPEEVRAWASL